MLLFNPILLLHRNVGTEYTGPFRDLEYTESMIGRFSIAWAHLG